MELEIGENAFQVTLNEEKENTKWVSHYSNRQQMLLVGEGDFSFSSCLATAFGTANCIIATSLDSPSDLQQKYGKDAFTNISNLVKRGAQVFHDFDACHMVTKHATPLCSVQQTFFDRIIFNFPHAGFPSSNAEAATMMQKHKELLRRFFANASCMLLPGGEVHVSHKLGDAYNEWKLEEHAQMVGLRLIKCAPFVFEAFPGYHTRRGAAKEAGKRFPLGQAATYIFCLEQPATPINLKMKIERDYVLDNRLRPKTIIGHNPLFQAKSRSSDLRDQDLSKSLRKDGGYDSEPSSSFSTAMCHVAMKATGEGYSMITGHNPLFQTESGPSDLGNLRLSESTGEDMVVCDSGPSSPFPTTMCHVAMKGTGEGYSAVLLQIAKLVQKGRACEETPVVQVLADEVARLEKKQDQLGKKKMAKLKSLKSALKYIKITVLEEETSDLLDTAFELPICLRFCEFCGGEFRRELKNKARMKKDARHNAKSEFQGNLSTLLLAGQTNVSTHNPSD